MLKKAFKKLTGGSKKKETTPVHKPSAPKAPEAKLLTAEGWKRLMMKKSRKG